MPSTPTQRPNNQLPETLQRAVDAMARNDNDTALQLLNQAMDEDPTSALPPFLMGAELAQMGRYQDAESAYASAVLLAPEFSIARFELGTLQFTSGRATVALMTWEPLLKLPDTDALKMFVHGYAHLTQDAFDESLAWFHRGMVANTANEALNGNIRKLVAAIEKARGMPPSQASLQPGAQAQPEPQAEAAVEDAHFLVANYGRQGSLQ